MKHKIKKGRDKENFDIINVYLRLRVRKGKVEYLLKKDKEINHYLSKSKKIFTTRFLHFKSGYKTIKYFFYRIKIINSLEY